MIIFEHNGSDVSQFDDKQAPDLTITQLIRRLVQVSNLRECEPNEITLRYVEDTAP